MNIPNLQIEVNDQNDDDDDHNNDDQILVPGIAIPCFKNLSIEVLRDLLKDGQLFAPDTFEDNYNSLPQELKLIFDYESVEMAIDEVVEVIAFRIIKRNEENEEKNDN